MSRQEYEESREVDREGRSFYALIMAAMRQADSDNLERLRHGWPEVWAELRARYDAPGGVLPGEGHRITVQGYCHRCKCFPFDCDRTDTTHGHDPQHPTHEEV